MGRLHNNSLFVAFDFAQAFLTQELRLRAGKGAQNSVKFRFYGLQNLYQAIACHPFRAFSLFHYYDISVPAAILRGLFLLKKLHFVAEQNLKYILFIMHFENIL